MIGAIAGDIIGSVHEYTGTKSTDFELFVPASRFTDDTVLPVAVADCLLNGLDYVDTFDSLEDVLEQAARSAVVTHNHEEGVKGPQATAAAVFLALQGETKARIKHLLERRFGYNPSERLDNNRPTYRFDESCQGTVPAALVAFLESHDYEDAVRKAISLGGDADTLACITGAVAEAHYGGVPPHIHTRTLEVLDERLRTVVNAFCVRYAIRAG